MTRPASRKAFLVTPTDDSGTHGPVYATLTDDPSDAVSAVAVATGTEVERLSFAGSLSRKLARVLRLKKGEVRRI